MAEMSDTPWEICCVFCGVARKQPPVAALSRTRRDAADNPDAVALAAALAWAAAIAGLLRVIALE